MRIGGWTRKEDCSHTSRASLMIACFQGLGSMIKVSEVKVSKWWSKTKCSVFIGDSSRLGLGVTLRVQSRAERLKLALGDFDFRGPVQVRIHSCFRLMQFRHGCASSHLVTI
jgi:hypothetical protein